MKRVCITGASGSGKTRLVIQLVSWLSRRGLIVGTLKHAHHDFDMDRKGKDSARHFEAGADVSGVISPHRTAVFRRTRRRVRPRDLLSQFRGCDVLIAEGFRAERFARIEVYRRAVSPRPLFQIERYKVRAVVTRDAVPFPGPTFRPHEIGRIAHFIMNEI